MAQNQIRARIIAPEDFKALRKSTGLSQGAAGKAIGLCRTAISMYERGLRPAPKYAITLLQILAAKREALITGKKRDIMEYFDAPFDLSL